MSTLTLIRSHLPAVFGHCRRLGLGVLLLATGCASPRGNAEIPVSAGQRLPGPPISVDRPSYTLGETGPFRQPGVTIVATYRNPTPEPLYLDTCDKRLPLWHLEKRTSSGWAAAYEPACTLIAPEVPLVLAPGQTRTDTLTVVDHGPDVPRFVVEPIPGTYRLVYRVRARPEIPGEPAPLEQRVSAEFEIGQ